jgi:hypothetical protein
LAIGISSRRFSWRTLPIESPSRTFGASRASRRMPGGKPDVQTVMLRASIASPHGSFSTSSASSTRSRLASGSPIP